MIYINSFGSLDPIPFRNLMRNPSHVVEIVRTVFAIFLATRSSSTILSSLYYLGPTTAGLAIGGHLMLGRYKGSVGDGDLKRLSLSFVGYFLTTSFVRHWLNKLNERGSFYKHEPDKVGNPPCPQVWEALPLQISSKIYDVLPPFLKNQYVGFFIITSVGLLTAYPVALATLKISERCGIAPEVGTLLAHQLFPYQVKIWLGFKETREGIKAIQALTTLSRAAILANDLKRRVQLKYDLTAEIMSLFFKMYKWLSATNPTKFFLCTYPITRLLRAEGFLPNDFQI